MPTITIPRGSTLSGLAKKHATSVQELMKLNPSIKDANLIRAGAMLNLPYGAPAAAPKPLVAQGASGSPQVHL